MKIQPKDVKKIQVLYRKMKSKEELLDILNFIKTLIFESHKNNIELKQLNYYISNSSKKKRYREFILTKKSGGSRVINSPTAGLKIIQSCLNELLSIIFTPHESAFGFIRSKSIIENAVIHINNLYVFNLDLKDFFPSIYQSRIWSRLQYPPFNLNDKFYRKDLANIIATLTCCEYKNGKFALPQGGPTSPIISNIIAYRLDYYLTAVAKRFGCQYSRYADDITFSSMNNIFSLNGELRKEINRIIKTEGFIINETKTRLQSSSFKQEVTGLIVNKKVNVRKTYIKDIRKWLYLCETYGLEKAQIFFANDYGKPLATPSILDVLKGKISFLIMVRGSRDSLTKKLKSRLNNLNLLKGTYVRKNVSESPKVFLQKPLVHFPRNLVSYLKKFSENDSSLKYSTHIWDNNGMGLISFLENLHNEYEKFSYPLKALHEPLNAKIFNFLLNSKVADSGWGIHRVRFGWNSPELTSIYLKQKQNIYPGDIIIPEKYQFQIEDKIIQKFSQVIDIFKNEIEVRDEQDTLYNILVTLFDKHLQSFNFPEFRNFENITFFTDVQSLTEVLEIILFSFRSRPQNPNLLFSVLFGEDQSIELHLEQIGSFNIGKSYHDEKLTTNRGDFGSLFKKLKNICDWSIESTFQEGAYRINYLISDTRTPSLIKISKNTGFKHILKFYR